MTPKKIATTATATGLLAALALTACGDDPETTEEPEAAEPDHTEWFTENCPAEVNNIREDYDTTGDDMIPEGDVVGEAMLQGAIRPPAALDNSTEEIGLYTYDELSEEMVLETTATSDDLFCFDQGIATERDDRQIRVDSHQITGEAHDEDSDQSFTELRSPDYPDGIWVPINFTSMSESRGGGFEVSEEWGECSLEWSPATDITPVDDAPEAEREVVGTSVISPDDC